MPSRTQACRELEEAELAAWRSFLRSHASIVRSLDADLVAEHSLTLNDYEVLLYLAQAPGGRLRMSDLAQRVLLTRSGVTRLVDGLERAGFVRRAACPGDARVSYAELTEDGRSALRCAAETHVRGVRELFGERFSAAELTALAELLGRLPGAGADGSCLP